MIAGAWIDYVKRTMVVLNEVDWSDIPGYYAIVEAIILEMSNREVVDYPDSLKATTVSFISNVRLLNEFVKIVFKKTHAYDPYTVNKSLELVTSWLVHIHKNGALIPPDFDFVFFFKGVNMLLNLDHGTSTAKVIWMLYQVMHVIPKKQRDYVLLTIL